jgi:hypothetical protein
MIYITNPLILPLIILIWSADAWLWLVSIRLLLGRIVSADNSVYNALRCLTDVLPEHVNRCLAKWSDRSLPRWIPWLITFIGLIALRHMLLQLIISLQNR